jgi:hypothetical protein
MKPRTNLKPLVLVLGSLGLVVGALAPHFASDARADFATKSPGSGNSGTVTAKAQFRVIIATALTLRIGTAGATIDTAQFNLTGVPPADGSHPSPFSPPFGIGSGTQTGIVGTLNGVGAATTIPVTVAVTSTLSTVSLTASVSGSNLTSGGNTIPYTQISASSSSANLPSPVIPASGSGAARTISGCDVSCSGVVNRSATWTYTYANTATVNNAGTYTGQISYTATSP